ncbi:MAG: hypothetical protein M0R03_23590 [Novosphingobium sp.]|jgi:hypothetical protein|nr:hypothetical protein [Novosphingobium sp.]
MNKQIDRNRATSYKIEKIFKKLLEENKRLKSITVSATTKDNLTNGFEVTRRSKLK